MDEQQIHERLQTLVDENTLYGTAWAAGRSLRARSTGACGRSRSPWTRRGICCANGRRYGMPARTRIRPRSAARARWRVTSSSGAAS